MAVEAAVLDLDAGDRRVKLAADKQALAAAQQTGWPPNVVPCEPIVKAFATSSRAQMASIGMLSPSAFAIETISGLMP